jgi:hypothetical protein
MPEIAPLGLQLKALWNPLRSEGDILVGIFFLKLFDVVPLPVIFSTLQFNQILGEVDVIALTSIQFGLHPGWLPVDLFNHGFRHPSDFRAQPFSFKIVKQTLITFYHISFSKRGKEEGSFSAVRKEAKESFKEGDLGLIAISPDEKIGEGKF